MPRCTPRRTARSAAGLVVATFLLAWLPGVPEGRTAPAPPCFLFADPLGTYMVSSQVLSISRVVGLARALGCKVLPPFLSLGPHSEGDANWANGTIPLGAYFSREGGASDAFADFADASQMLVLARAVAAARGKPEPEPPPNLRADRTALSLHQSRNERPLALPCLVGSHSLGDARVARRTQPFSCKELVVLERWATHPRPQPSPELGRFRRSLAGRLLAVPQPFMLDLDCALEAAGSAELPSRIELLRAAKWLLWNAILAPDVASLAVPGDDSRVVDAVRAKLAAAREIPPLDSPAYASYPVPSPVLVTAHVRSARNHVQFCAHRMRFPLCATDDSAAAHALADLARRVPRPTAMFLAGDKLIGVPGWGRSTEVLDALDGIPLEERPAVFSARAFGELYRAVLSHPSLAFTDHSHLLALHGTGAEQAHWAMVAIAMDQILLGCGDLLRGGLHQTYWSTFSMRSRASGQAVGAAVCLPSDYPAPRIDTAVTRAERDAEAAQLSAAGVDFSLEHEHRGTKRRTLGPEEWAMGCMRKGRFLPSLGFAERLASNETCRFCGGTGRW
ncbi:hypothetical protein DFJ74DRAFT_711828 [Hyaloraphidium curvatum]|nr:hypothetical protein DFJ74DRAFT_711828 [Hyaloraphidium curvatum]